MNSNDAARFVAEGYFGLRLLPTGELAGLYRFIFTTGLCVGLQTDGPEFTIYRCRYCYQSEGEALAALVSWDGRDDPPGPWIKQKGLGIDRSNPLKLAGIPIVHQVAPTALEIDPALFGNPNGNLNCWVLYDNPKDFPGQAVARKFTIDARADPQPTNEHVVASTVAPLRIGLQKSGRVPFQRDPQDDPAIVEIWV